MEKEEILKLLNNIYIKLDDLESNNFFTDDLAAKVLRGELDKLTDYIEGDRADEEGDSQSC